MWCWIRGTTNGRSVEKQLLSTMGLVSLHFLLNCLIERREWRLNPESRSLFSPNTDNYPVFVFLSQLWSVGSPARRSVAPVVLKGRLFFLDIIFWHFIFFLSQSASFASHTPSCIHDSALFCAATVMVKRSQRLQWTSTVHRLKWPFLNRWVKEVDINILTPRSRCEREATQAEEHDWFCRQPNNGNFCPTLRISSNGSVRFQLEFAGILPGRLGVQECV